VDENVASHISDESNTAKEGWAAGAQLDPLFLHDKWIIAIYILFTKLY